MAENFNPKTKPAKTTKTKPKAAAKAKPSSKTDGLRAMREKSVETSVPAIVNASGAVVLGTLKTAGQFLEAGRVIWGRTVSAIFEMSELLDLAHDKLTKAEYSGLLGDLHISESSASQMRKISASDRMRKLLDDGTVFPTSSHTLYLLASMDDAEFGDFTKKHDIDPDVRVEDVRSFLKERKTPRQPSTPKNTAEATQQAKVDTAAQLTTPTGDGNGPLIEDATYTTVDTANGETKTDQPEDGQSPGAAAEEPESDAMVALFADKPIADWTNDERLASMVLISDGFDNSACKSLSVEELTEIERGIDKIATALDSFRREVSELIFNA